MKLEIEDIVEKIKNETPTITRRCDDKTIKKIILETLGVINKEVRVSTVDAKVIIPRLGRFVKKEIEKDGKKQTRVIFLASENKR